jgi:hypothetical protein
MKIEIKSIKGEVLFSFEKENNTVMDTLLEGVRFGANIQGANLEGANLTVIKNDLFIVLLHSVNEIKYLKQNLINGEIDGSTYDGDCCCLSGTLCKNSNNEKLDLILSQRDSLRPIERFFLGIKIGDNPENSQFSKLALDWINEFENLINVK